MPTVLDLLGVETPKEVTGSSLVPLMTGAAVELNLDAYSEADVPAASLRVERPSGASGGTLQGYRRAPAGVVRHRGRPERSGEPLRTAPGPRDSMLTQLKKREQAFEKTEAPLPAGDVDPERVPGWRPSLCGLVRRKRV